MVWKPDVALAPLVSHLRCNKNPTVKCAAVNVSSLGDCLCVFKGNTVFLPFVHCYSVILSRLVVLMWAVCQTVPSQVTVAPKHLSAAATAVGLDVCMGEKVSFQVTSLIKGSSACGAFVGRLLFRFKASKGLFSLIV